MIRIGICADAAVSAGMEKIINVDLKKLELELFIYSDILQMYQMLEDNENIPDIIFCEANGSSDLVRQIRKRNSSVDVVLLMPRGEVMGDIILYRTYGILTYPVNAESLESIIDAYADSQEENRNEYFVTVNRDQYMIDLDSIHYFECRKRVIYTHGLEDEIHFYKSIGSLERDLSDKGFVRCQRSFLVNAKYVEEVHREYLIVKGERVSVGRDYYEQSDGSIWKSLRKWNKIGAIIGVGGRYDGVIFRIKPEVEIFFGTDARYSDIVINDDIMSEKQGMLMFHKYDKSYSLRNISGKDIIINNKQRIYPGESVQLKIGDVFGVEDSVQYFELG